jgi:endosialidase-like protein
MKKNLICSGMITAALMFAVVKTNAQTDWHITGNAGTTPATNFIGTTDNQDLRIRTNNVVRVAVTKTGRVGIGQNAPAARLHVQGGTGTTDTIPVINAVVKKTGNKEIVAIHGESQPAAGWGVGVEGLGNDVGVFGNGGNAGVLGNAVGVGVQGQSSGSPGDTTTATGAISDGVDCFGGPGNQSTGVYAQAGGGHFNYGVIGLCGPNYNPSDSDNTHLNWAGYYFGDIVYSRSFRWSDAKLKNNVQPLANALEKLYQVQTSTYSFKRSEFPQLELPVGKQIGFIAENVESVFPELVTVTRSPKIVGNKYGKVNRDPVTFKSVDYEGILPIVVAAIKEQKTIVDAQSAQIADLNARLAALEARLGEGASAKLSSTSSSVDASLEQNSPNPFNQSTQIRYTVPKNYSSAQIIITSVDGKAVRTYSISGTGKGQITLNASELAVGTYTYSLNLDGKVVDSKNLVLTK